MAFGNCASPSLAPYTISLKLTQHQSSAAEITQKCVIILIILIIFSASFKFFGFLWVLFYDFTFNCCSKTGACEVNVSEE